MPTNYERIKAMSIDEMAEFLMLQNKCFKCVNLNLPICKSEHICNVGIKQWLESESE